MLLGKHEGKQQLGKVRHRWKDNIEMNVLILKGMDGIYLDQNREQWKYILNTAMWWAG
jgi:hypothetical protein